MKTLKTQPATAWQALPPEKLSKTAQFWQKYPEGIITVYDRRAVNK